MLEVWGDISLINPTNPATVAKKKKTRSKGDLTFRRYEEKCRNFSSCFGIFPHSAEMADRFNCVFFFFLATVAGLLGFINKMSAQNFSI